MRRFRPTPGLRHAASALLLTCAVLSGCTNPLGCASSDQNRQRFEDALEGATVMVGDTTTLVVGYYPSTRGSAGACGLGDSPGVTSKSAPSRFSWVSSNTSVLTVERGLVRAVGVGEAVVTSATSGAPPAYTTVFVVPRVAGAVVRPSEVTARVGEVVRFDAYLVDEAGRPHDTRTNLPYPVDLRAEPSQDADVVNYLPQGPRELRKSFSRAGTYRLDLLTVVRNVGPFEDAAEVTVVP